MQGRVCNPAWSHCECSMVWEKHDTVHDTVQLLSLAALTTRNVWYRATRIEDASTTSRSQKKPLATFRLQGRADRVTDAGLLSCGCKPVSCMLQADGGGWRFMLLVALLAGAGAAADDSQDKGL